MITRGNSPRSAANHAIVNGIVESERASIVMIPYDKEPAFIQYQDRLLSEETAVQLLKKLGLTPVRT